MTITVDNKNVSAEVTISAALSQYNRQLNELEKTLITLYSLGKQKELQTGKYQKLANKMERFASFDMDSQIYWMRMHYNDLCSTLREVKK